MTEVLVDVECEFKELPLDCLTLGQHQARTRELSEGIEDLARNIKSLGLLQPIVVCPDEEDPEMYYIVAGQRRFLAHQQKEILDKDSIMCRVYGEPLGEAQQIAISYAENAVRNTMVSADHIDVCVKLYYRYGTFAEVARQTGLSAGLISKYVKFERLHPDVQDQVKNKGLRMDTAIRATQAQEMEDGEGNADPKEVLELAWSMQPMSDPEQKAVLKKKRENPEATMEEIVHAGNSQKVQQMVLELSDGYSRTLDSYAQDTHKTRAAAATAFIVEGLDAAGYAPDSQ